MITPYVANWVFYAFIVMVPIGQKQYAPTELNPSEWAAMTKPAIPMRCGMKIQDINWDFTAPTPQFHTIYMDCPWNNEQKIRVVK